MTDIITRNDRTTLLEPAQLVDGAWTPAEHQFSECLTHPTDGTVLQHQAATSAATVESAVAAAWRDHRAHPMGIGDAQERARALRLVADAMEARAEAVAQQDTLNSGVPLTVTRLFADSLGATFRSAADQIGQLAMLNLGADGRDVRLHHLPLGPAAVLAPWNAPTATAAKKAAFAWAAGCTVIVKPSPWSPHGTMILIEAMRHAASAAGLPTASIQLVLGGAETGQALAGSPHVRALSFTGSRANGRAVAAAAATTAAALQLELGSNNPAVVLPDADLDRTADHLVAGMTKLNGAWCESPSTVFVPESIREQLIEALLDQLTQLRIGDPLDEHTTFGPQANLPQHARLRHQVEEFTRAGARIHTAGQHPASGFWVLPTLVIDPPHTLASEEIFGPVLIIRTCRDPDQALEHAYELDTGLAGYIFTRSPIEGHRIGVLLPAGEIKINGTSLLDMSDRSQQQFWYGSGIGGHGDAELLRFFTGARIVGDDVQSPL